MGNHRTSDRPTAVTRNEISVSFYKMMPGIKILDYSENDVIKDVCKYFDITDEEIKDKGRKRVYIVPRQIAMYFIAKMFPKITYENIGLIFGGKNHATVTHSIKVVEDLNFADKNFCYRLRELKEIIESHILEKSDKD